MPSEAALTGRCYCGDVRLTLTTPPLTTAYCHCSDCKRWTGSPLPAFAAFPRHAVDTSQFPAPGFSTKAGVERWICPRCGSPLAATFDYLPDQIYVPVGILNDAASLSPELHCHADQALPWLCMSDELPRSSSSGRDLLNEAGATDG